MELAEDLLSVPELNIGSRLRHARLIKRLNLKEVAATVGCSEGFLSRVENDKVKPSLSTLHRLAAALGTNITTLFASGDMQDSVLITRKSDRDAQAHSRMRIGMGVSLEILLPQFKGMLLQAGIHVIEPYGNSDGMISHQGEEVGYVLEGEIELVVEGQIHRLKEGDSFFFRSDLEHGYRNPIAKSSRVLWINTPPTF